MAGADTTLGTESQFGSERCSSDPVQCLATCLCYAKGQAVCAYTLQLFCLLGLCEKNILHFQNLSMDGCSLVITGNVM